MSDAPTLDEFRTWIQTLSRDQLLELAIAMRWAGEQNIAYLRHLEKEKSTTHDIVSGVVELLEGAIANYKLVVDHKTIAARGGLARSQKDPRSMLKPVAKGEWDAWKMNPKQYRSGAAFAHAFVKRHAIITNTKTVENWVSTWEAEAREKARGN